MGQYYWHPDILEEYDVFPLVTACGKESRMTIRPTGGRQIFVPGKEYQLEVCAFEQGEPLYFPLSGSFKKETIRANQEGGFEVTHLFSSEQAYYLRFSDPDGNILYEYPVYAVNDDLQKRYPFWGDLHLHTTCSDGAQTPEVMTADCRAHGYDFLAITDHRRYYPSLRAIDFCRNLPTELCVCPGEEVQLSAANGRINDVHIINFGGEYSINALFPGEQRSEVGTDPAIRSLFGKCPEACSQEAYNALMTRLTEEIRVPAGVDPYPAASCKWIFEEIRKAGGLGILAHPYWLNNVFHIPAGLLDYLVENRIFDAMEVLGG
ncbi:MAG: hypothetical protein IJM83_02620, partial [Firmicutes bacterium]|nr:hypothetical protein [Bacillota bacterium]